MKLIDRARRVDPLGPLMAAAALVVFLAQGFDSILTRDLALYSYGAQQTVEGVPPYVSVLNRAGPLAHLVPAIGVAFARAVADRVRTLNPLISAEIVAGAGHALSLEQPRLVTDRILASAG